MIGVLFNLINKNIKYKHDSFFVSGTTSFNESGTFEYRGVSSSSFSIDQYHKFLKVLLNPSDEDYSMLTNIFQI